MGFPPPYRSVQELLVEIMHGKMILYHLIRARVLHERDRDLGSSLDAAIDNIKKAYRHAFTLMLRLSTEERRKAISPTSQARSRLESMMLLETTSSLCCTLNKVNSLVGES